MNPQSRLLSLRETAALAMALALVLGVVTGAPFARAEDTGEGTVQDLENAEFRWAINKEAGTRAFAPGTFNLLSAGDISSAITGGGQKISEADWHDKSGNVRIEKRSSTSVKLAEWTDTQTDLDGQAISSAGSAHSGLEAVFSNGTGSVDSEAGTADVSWKGTVSAVFYSGMSYFTISDPVLKVTSANAQVTATLGGFKSDMNNSDVWEEIPPQVGVVIADLPTECVDLSGTAGFSVSPDYLGVEYQSEASPQVATGEYFGSFPKGFVDFADKVGTGPYWYSSGGSADRNKPALPISIGWRSGDSASLKETCASPSSGGSEGIIGQVIDDAIEDIARAAGTDVSDTAAAWMDEAWKPLQPAGAKAVVGGGGTATSPGGDPVAAKGADLGTDSSIEDEYVAEYFVDTPVTAGTVGAAVASAPASPGSSASTPATPSTLADQAMVPVAASSPLNGSDAVYAHTSASQKAGSLAHQWQWWAGAVLLALAAMLFYQTVRRKD